MRLPKVRLHLLLAALAAAVSAQRANADVQGFNPANACTSVAGMGSGTTAWTNAAGATPAGLNYAAAAIPGNGSTQYLRCNDFRFTVPTGATIDAVTMQTSHRRASGAIADLHVYPVRDASTTIGSVGTDRALSNCANDWTNAFNTVPYANAALPPWGITWGACDKMSATCSEPPGSFNVNSPDFGAAIAAKNCTAGGAEARVDSVDMQVTYTVTPCDSTAWGPVSVALANAAPSAVTAYTITTKVPNKAGCALIAGSFLTVALPAGVTSTATGGSVSVAGGTPVLFTPINSGNSASIQITNGMLQPCGTTQCIPADTPLTIVLNGVTNPSSEGNVTLTVRATPVLAPSGGTTVTTTSGPFTIALPCTSTSQWGPTTVTPADTAQSLPAVTGGLPACPRFTKYTVVTSVPTQFGCDLSTTSDIVITFPTPGAGTVGTDATTITAIRVGGTAVPFPLTPPPTPLVVRFHPPGPLAHGQSLTIELDTVQNPSATTPQTLTLQAAGTLNNGSSAVSTSAPYSLTTATACAPGLDFFVRDWTTSATVHDTGEPVPPQAAGPNWASTSDVWNQYSSTPPAIPADDWVRGGDLATTATNRAFARISLRTPSATPVPKRPARATFYLAPFGISQPFGLLGSTIVDLSSPAVTPGPFVDLLIDPMKLPTLGTHSCLAIEIESRDDPRTQPSIAMQMVTSATTDAWVRADPNMAQRNLWVVMMPTPPPPPPPPSPKMGPMSGFAMIHNAGTRVQDMKLRVNVPREGLEHLRDATVAVVGRGEPVALAPGATITLPAMQPSEDRWIDLGFTLASGGEGTLVPVNVQLMAGETPVSELTWGIQASPLSNVVGQNLGMHRDVFSRLARVFDVGEGKSEAAAAARLLEGKREISDALYAAFLKEHARAMGAAITRFVHGDPEKDPFGLMAAQERLQKSLGERDPRVAAIAHLALLERLDAAQTMRVLARGNPADIIGMVRWQEDVYSNVPQLAQLPGAAELVKESQTYIEGYAGTPGDAKEYTALLAKSQKLFQATASAAKKDGVDAGPALAALERQRKAGDTAALQKAHHEFLLALEPLRSSGDVAQQKKP